MHLLCFVSAPAVLAPLHPVSVRVISTVASSRGQGQDNRGHAREVSQQELSARARLSPAWERDGGRDRPTELGEKPTEV